MTHEPIDGRTWCLFEGAHWWVIDHDHFAPCCAHRGHWLASVLDDEGTATIATGWGPPVDD